MGLKTDILKAFEKNLTHIEVVEGENKTVKPPIEKDSKLEVLAEDLANAILDFLTNKDRCVLKVDKINMNYTSGPTPVTVGPPTPHTIPLLDIGVDKKGQKLSNPVGGGSIDSNASEVRLRKSNVRGESDKY
jgi:hypothetical protein